MDPAPSASATPAAVSCVAPNPRPVPGDAASFAWLSSPRGRDGERPDIAVQRVLRENRRAIVLTRRHHTGDRAA